MFVMAAAFKHLKAQAHAHPIHGTKRNSKLPPVNEELREKEKRFVLDHESHCRSAEPDQSNVDTKRTQLGTSSKQLRVQDFELVKTLGTGAFGTGQPPPNFARSAYLVLQGLSLECG